MDYTLHYDRLISRARTRVIDGYVERHHVLPRCMGGDNTAGNLVNLTPEEHYVAHQLLVKMHPDVKGLINAVVFLTARNPTTQHMNNHLYGWLKRRNSTVMSERLKGNKHLLGFKHSKYSRDKISSKLLGRNKPASMIEKTRARVSGSGNPMYGKPRTDEQRAAQSMKMSGRGNGKFDPSIRRFVNVDGKEYIGTSYDFMNDNCIEQSCVSHLIRGRYHSSHGWMYKGLLK